MLGLGLDTRFEHLRVGRGPVRSPETEQGLEGSHRLLAPIMAKDEFIKIGLEPTTAYGVMGTEQALFEAPMARSAKGTTDFVPFCRSARKG